MNEFLTQLQGSLAVNFLAALLTGFLAFSIGRLLGVRKLCAGLGVGIAVLGVVNLAGFQLISLLPGKILMLAVPAVSLLFLYLGNRIHGRLKWHFADFCRENTLFCVLAGLFLLANFASLCYLPYAYDEQVYQIALVRRWLDAHSLAVFFDNPFSAFPSLGQFFFLWSAQMSGIGSIHFLTFGAYFLAITSLYSRMAKSGKGTALILTLALLLSPLYLMLLRENGVESLMLLFLAGFLELTDEAERPFPVLPGGILLGALAAVKLTGAGLIPAVLLIWILSKKPDRTQWMKIIRTVLIAGAFAFVFYLRPWILTGNPLYPYFASIFSADPSARAMSEMHHLMGSYGYGLSGLPGLALGWLFAAFDGNLFDGIVLGWQFIVLYLLALIAAVKYRDKMALAMLLLYLFWFFTSQQTRFMAMLFWVSIPAAGIVIAALPKKWKQTTLTIISLLTILSFPLDGVNHWVTSFRLLFANVPPSRFVAVSSHDFDYMALLEIAEKTLPHDAEILLLFNQKNLYIPRRHYLIGTPYFQEKFFTPVPTTAHAVLETLRQNKITHILYAPTINGPDNIPQFTPHHEALATHIQQLLKENALKILPGSAIGESAIMTISHTTK